MIEDHGEVRLETTEGFRPAPPRGERVLVALAAVALLGAALILGGNLLNKKDDQVSTASASPRESPSPTPFFTPFPTPSPRELAVVETSPVPTETATQSLFSGWVRASVDLPIHPDADENAAVVGTLRAGSVAYLDEQGQGAPDLGWATIAGVDPTGWVAMRSQGKDLVKRYLPADLPVSGGLWSIAAGPNGFLAVGSPAGRSSSYPPPALYLSRDGATWRAASEPTALSSSIAGVAWGPAGWLVVGNDPSGFNGDTVRIWSSPDGERWTSPGVLPANYPEYLAGSASGYLLRTGTDSGFGGWQEVLWFSSDGVHWSESRPGLTDSNYAVTATEAGFYVSTSQVCCQPASTWQAAFSTDGLTWYPTRPNLWIGAVDGAIIGIEPHTDGPGALAYRGSFYRGRLGWHLVKGGDQPFVGAIVTSAVSDGHRARAFGWDAATHANLTWTSDGGPWTRQALPETFGGPPAPAALGGGGVVVVGNRTNWRGPNPIFWHQNADGSWEPEPSPVLGIARDPSAEDCGAPPTDPVLFINLDRALAAACYGDAPFTIRIWSSHCDGCYGQPDGTYDEAWLANPTGNQLYLSPVVWPDTSWATAVLAPEFAKAPDPSWLGAWLDLTGHFNDPASARCRWTPPQDQVQYYVDPRSQQDQCRQQFVVTNVEVVDGP